MRLKFVLQACAALLLSVLASSAFAQSKEMWETFDQRVKASRTVSALGPDLFGDQVSYSNGALSFAVTDVSIPGNSSLPVAFGRRFTVTNRKGLRNDSPLADWDIDVPTISGMFAPDWVNNQNSPNRCSVSPGSASPPNVLGFQAANFWNGINLSIPGGPNGELIIPSTTTPKPTSGGPYYWMTNDLAFVSCLPTIQNGSGEGFLVLTPDGTKYRFDRLAQYVAPQLISRQGGTTLSVATRRNVMYATRVEDRFGNWVEYTYTNASNAPARLTKILSNDGRQLDIGYNANGHIGTVTDGQRTWQYQYGTVTLNSGGATDRTLTAVIQPDASQWTINFAVFSNTILLYAPFVEEDQNCRYSPPPYGQDAIGSITHPSGAQGSFTVGVQRHYNGNVPTSCTGFMTAAKAKELVNYANGMPVAFDTFSLKTKSLTGPSLGTQEWTYSYSSSPSTFNTTWVQPNHAVCPGNVSCAPPQCTSDSCASTNSTTVTGPGGEWVSYSHGNAYQYNIGKLLRVTRGSTATGALSTQKSRYDLTQTQQAYPAKFGASPRWRDDGFTATFHRPLLEQTVVQDSVTYSKLHNTLDSWARPLSVTRSNTVGPTRTDVTVYQDDPAKWVMGQVRSRTNSNTGLVESLTDYYAASALPQNIYAFGQLQRSYTYNTDGTVATAKDGLNRTTTLSSWKRGVPQSILHPDSNSTAVVIDNLGWMTSLTDERSNLTAYQYDPLGRMKKLTHPTGDVQTWTATDLTYVKLTAAELGMPAGGWRQREVTGRYQRSLYFDARLQPVLEEEKDLTTGVVRYTRRSYDDEGRVIFESYPSATLAATAGINSAYDPLGRLKQRQTTGGVTLQSIAYLSGNREQLTDAEGNVTTITRQFFDQPGTGAPLLIESPEGQTTTISRDVFGKLMSVTQSGIYSGSPLSYTRSFEYDSAQRPCRRIDPESGSTVWGYNAASEVIWEAKGQTGTGCLASAPAGATLYEYWPRGSKKKDDYPGTAEDVSYGYDPALNLTSVSNSLAAWTYTYNKRDLLETEQVVIDGKTLTLNPAYNSLGQRSSLTTPSQTISYAPDAWGQPTQLGSWTSGIQYHPNGMTSAYTLGSGLTYSQQLDSRQRLWVQDTRDGGSSIQKFVYSYSDAGNLIGIDDQVDNSDDTTLGYDDLHRLTSAVGLWGAAGYSYDPLNNLRSRTGPNALSYSYDTSNRLSTISGSQTRTYGYNANGEITGDGTKSFTLNSQGQIQSISGLASYGYDGHGKRIKTVKGSSTEYALYDRAGKLVYTETGMEKTDYLSLNGSTIVELKKVGLLTTPTYLHADLLGSPRKATGMMKSVLWQEHFDPYGSKLNNAASKIGYTGHAYDSESGYTYAQARFYDPLVGRFLSTDPVYFTDDSPYTFNRYSYANNNPYRFTDPTGASSVDQVDAVPILEEVGNVATHASTAGSVVGADESLTVTGGDAGGLSKATKAFSKLSDVADVAKIGAEYAAGNKREAAVAAVGTLATKAITALTSLLATPATGATVDSAMAVMGADEKMGEALVFGFELYTDPEVSYSVGKTMYSMNPVIPAAPLKF